MSNPLDTPAAASASQDEGYLLNLCHQNNRWAFRIGMPKWQYVEPASLNKPAQILTVDGIAAHEVWAVAAGQSLEYAGWDRERLDKLERRCRWLLARGTVAEA